MVALALNPSYWEIEIVDFWVWGQPGLQRKSQDSQGYTEKQSLQKGKKKNQKEKCLRNFGFLCIIFRCLWIFRRVCRLFRRVFLEFFWFIGFLCIFSVFSWFFVCLFVCLKDLSVFYGFCVLLDFILPFSILLYFLGIFGSCCCWSWFFKSNFRNLCLRLNCFRVARHWWLLPLIPELGKQRQVDFLIQGQPGLQRELQDSQEYTEKSSLQPSPQKKKGEKNERKQEGQKERKEERITLWTFWASCGVFVCLFVFVFLILLVLIWLL